jgi:hypothetical protein
MAVELAFEMSNTPPDDTVTSLEAEMVPGADQRQISPGARN